MLLTVISLLVALSVLVFVHELGHYLAAKRVGVVVEEFGFGYPPRLFSFWHMEGEVVLDGKKIIIPRELQVPEELTVGTQVAYATRTDEEGRQVLTEIEKVEPDAAEAIAASRLEYLDPGTLFSVNAIPFGGFAKMLGEEDPSSPGSLASKGKLARIFVLSAGAGMNLVFAILFFAAAMMLGAPTAADGGGVLITGVSPDSPAEAAGLQAEDVVIAGNGTAIETTGDLQAFTQDHLGEEVVLSIERGSEVIEVALVPRPAPPAGEGPIGIGISPRTEIVKYPWYEALWMSVRQTGYMAYTIFTVPVQVVQGLIPAELARPVGPVGVGQIVGDAVQFSLDTGLWFPAMQIMGSLSVALALTNLLPLPALDGGRILFIIIEGIRGKRIDPAREGLIHLIGMALLVALMIFITFQDVLNPVPSVDWGSLF
jgi:regulator of sigma E protease